MEVRSSEAQPGSRAVSARDTLIRVAIVDDHPVICDALTAAIRREPDMLCCGAAHSAREGFDLLAGARPDVAVVDISLGDAHGLTLIARVRSELPAIHLVVYSMTSEAAYAERTIRAGAMGYVAKSEPPSMVLEAIRTAYQEHVYLNSRIASRLLNKIVYGSDNRVRTGLDSLTDQEMFVFQMLGSSYSIEQIAERLGVSRKTAVAYRGRAQSKLGLKSVGRLVQHAIECAQGIEVSATLSK